MNSSEIEAATRFFVYLHKRPDGSVFYVGKGSKARANEFAPSRRTAHHRNVVAKHGREDMLKRWLATEPGKAHIARIVALRLAKATYKWLVCAQCGFAFDTKSNRAKCCSELCQQRLRRANGGR